MDPMLNTAIKAARKAGDLVLRYLDRGYDLEVSAKGRNDFVTEVDRTAEQIIIDALRNAYPDHAFVAEESGEQGDSDFHWIIDPLDGTTNFLYGFPHFAISIALRHRGRLQQAVIYDPLKQDLFTASRGGGAQLNGRRMRVGKRVKLDQALLGTGFPIRDPARLDQYIEQLRTFLNKSAGVRRAGSAALDLAYVACGRLDGFWEMGLQIWDIAAGALLVEEAGGLVGDLEGGSSHLISGDVAAGNPRIFRSILQTLKPRTQRSRTA